jgi:hypothetical protein
MMVLRSLFASFPWLHVLFNSGYPPLNLLFRLLPASFLKPRHNTALQFRDGYIFTRKELAWWDCVEISVINARRTGCDTPPTSIHREFDFNVCGKHVHSCPGLPHTGETHPRRSQPRVSPQPPAQSSLTDSFSSFLLPSSYPREMNEQPRPLPRSQDEDSISWRTREAQ